MFPFFGNFARLIGFLSDCFSFIEQSIFIKFLDICNTSFLVLKLYIYDRAVKKVLY